MTDTPDSLRDRIATAIYAEFRRQFDGEGIDTPLVAPAVGSDEFGGVALIDGEVNLIAAADAVIAALGTRRCERCRKTVPIDHFPDPHPGSDTMRPFCALCTRYIEWATS